MTLTGLLHFPSCFLLSSLPPPWDESWVTVQPNGKCPGNCSGIKMVREGFDYTLPLHTPKGVGPFALPLSILLLLPSAPCSHATILVSLSVSLTPRIKNCLYPGGLLLLYDALQDVLLKLPSTFLLKHARLCVDIDIWAFMQVCHNCCAFVCLQWKASEGGDNRSQDGKTRTPVSPAALSNCFCRRSLLEQQGVLCGCLAA